MARQEIRLELLLGKKVLGVTNKPIGPLEEIVAEQRGSELFVEEYHVGSYAMMERLSAWSIGRSVLKLFGATRRSEGYRVPWDQLDVSNVDQVRLLSPVSKLAKLSR
jgi:sporulation protein YlmC with PRC-barrel domain